VSQVTFETDVIGWPQGTTKSPAKLELLVVSAARSPLVRAFGDHVSAEGMEMRSTSKGVRGLDDRSGKTSILRACKHDDGCVLT